MSTTIIKSGILTRASGEEIAINDSEQETFRPNNTTIITCDGPRCASRHGVDVPVTVIVNDESARQDPNTVPDIFFRFFKAQPAPGDSTIVEFCGAQCVRDYLDYAYIAPLSPREKAEQIKNNEAIDSSHISRFESISQADGEAA